MIDQRRLGFLGFSIFSAVLGQFLLAQKDLAWTLVPGLAFCLAAILLFFLMSPVKVFFQPQRAGFSPGAELGWIAVLGSLSLFFRLFRYSSIPPGITREESTAPWLGYAVPLSQWHEFFTGGFSLTFPDVSFLAIPWFHLCPPSHFSFSLFCAFFSLMAFPLGYLLFRNLAGPLAALLALFFWAIMQWHVSVGRAGHPVASSLFYVLGALYFSGLAWRDRKPLSWILAGVFCGLGYYAYPLARACLPLLILVFAFEYRFRPPGARFPWAGTALFLLSLLAVLGPSLEMMRHQQSWLTGSPQDQAFIGRRVLEQKSLEPLWDNFSGIVLAFTREGCSDPTDSLPWHPILDKVTGALFGLGFVLGLGRWKERKYFYGIAGAVILALPAAFSNEPLHTHRMLGTAPFIAYLAALAALEVWERAAYSGLGRRLALAGGILAALAAVSENYKTYFMDRPLSEACWKSACVDTTRTGQAIADNGGAYEYYLSSTYSGLFEILFLGHGQIGHLHSLDLPASFQFLSPPRGRGLFFALQEGRTGVLAILQKEYPGGTAEKLLDPWGRPYLYFFRVPAEACSRDRFIPLDLNRAWKGTYWASPALDAPPVLVQKDPVLNFSYRDDFPVKNAPNLRAEWRGTLHPPKVGLYRFLLGATDHTKAEMEVDGKKAATLANQEAELSLAPRDYQVVIRYQREGGFESAFHLAWKTPGSDHYEIVPPEALR